MTPTGVPLHESNPSRRGGLAGAVGLALPGVAAVATAATPERVGTLLVDADTASEVTAAALLETRYELGRLGLVPPSDSEVDTARRYAIGSLLTATSSQGGLASFLMNLAGLGLDIEWFTGHPGRLAAVTVEQVTEALREASTSVPILLVEQNLEVVRRLARDAVVIAGGRVVHTGPAAGLLSDESLTQRLLGVHAETTHEARQ